MIMLQNSVFVAVIFNFYSSFLVPVCCSRVVRRVVSCIFRCFIIIIIVIELQKCFLKRVEDGVCLLLSGGVWKSCQIKRKNKILRLFYELPFTALFETIGKRANEIL